MLRNPPFDASAAAEAGVVLVLISGCKAGIINVRGTNNFCTAWSKTELHWFDNPVAYPAAKMFNSNRSLSWNDLGFVDHLRTDDEDERRKE